MPRTLIVGGLTYDISEFTIFRHEKGTLRGKLQYRLKSKGWWGPLVGYQEARWIFTIAYDESEPGHAAVFEATVFATIPEDSDPGDFDEHMESLAVSCVDAWVALPWDDVELKDFETIGNVAKFDDKIEVEVFDMRRLGRYADKPVHNCRFYWSEDKAREMIET